jgi:hypothetical protein
MFDVQQKCVSLPLNFHFSLLVPAAYLNPFAQIRGFIAGRKRKQSTCMFQAQNIRFAQDTTREMSETLLTGRLLTEPEYK